MGICARFKMKRLACILLILCVLYGVLQVAERNRILSELLPRGLKMIDGHKVFSTMNDSTAKPQNILNLLRTTPTPAKTKRKYTIPPSFNATYIGDVYPEEDESYRITDCPTAMRKKMMATEFAHIYLDKLPLLVWAKHAKPEEYKRLQIYNGCFGWDKVAWDILNETLPLLNTSANGYMFSEWNRKPRAGSPCIRCAAVGNGGILNGSKLGKEIDQHDYVFRVNGAVLNGFEEDVGNRTSFYFFSTNTMMNSLSAYGRDGFKHPPQSKETSYVFLPDHDRDYLLAKAAITHQDVDQGKDKGKRPSKYFGENYTREQFKILHPDFMRYLRNRFLLSNTLKGGSRDIYRPSTGASMLLTAIHACDEVNAYGFITPDFKKYSQHYYEKKKISMHFILNHDFTQEMQLWQKFHKLSIVKLYTRP
ncbi:alpha-N-acetylgalactosaminide alpha-2,6-sialyltransferase 2-like isoform X2 [Pleurodeles waltl]|uniref:alpha-N-acetylgalactosaminide alpha-2,6-sialyltransferase 2-like isoform X2 n=1 Tax=Pleurodeles waltl TaxID=8319 RepID=UPI003709619E